ncbi:MAG: GTP 3',8-cyclase MoaA [Acidobacteriota bacterium]
MAILDTLRRPLGTLRLSVTDRCNLRCHYCMPEQQYVWLPQRDVLSFEEIGRLADLFAEVGVDRVRLTGGEPLLRRDLPNLVALLAARPWLRDLALTTNGVYLADLARDLKRAGLHRVTVSLDTLRRDRFQRLARIDALPRVLAGIDAVCRTGFPGLKIDAVVTRGDNDDELVELVEFGRQINAEVRFIEYMDVGGATRWRPEAVVSRQEMLDQLAAHYGPIARLEQSSSAPATRFRLPDGRTFGIISSTTQPFCRTCDRARLTADGMLLLCLHAQLGTNLRHPLRAGASREALLQLIRTAWTGRADRGAEGRLAMRERGPRSATSGANKDVHQEMHTRGG